MVSEREDGRQGMKERAEEIVGNKSKQVPRMQVFDFSVIVGEELITWKRHAVKLNI